MRAVSSELPEGGRLQLIESLSDSVLADDEVVRLDRLGHGGGPLLTTRELLRLESELVGMAEHYRSRRAGLVESEVVEAVLAERPLMAGEQAEMVRRLTTSGDGVEVVVGKAETVIDYVNFGICFHARWL